MSCKVALLLLHVSHFILSLLPIISLPLALALCIVAYQISFLIEIHMAYQLSNNAQNVAYRLGKAGVVVLSSFTHLHFLFKAILTLIGVTR